MSLRTEQVAVPLSGRATALLLMVFGISALLILGFAQGELVHEFVHDGRHLLAFPCH